MDPGSFKSANSFRIDAGRIGLAEETSDGFLRLYMRLAVADRPMIYRGANGAVRHEAILADQLFRKDSTDTFKMLPLTLRHPEEQVVTPDNARRLGRGSTGHTILREQTPYGDFLGITSTLFDREAIQAVKAGWQISPGYRVGDLIQRADGVLLQQNRVGNHVAVVEKARGGKDIIPVLTGINTDAADDLWIVDFREDEEALWQTDLNHELISQLFNSETPPDSLLTRGVVNLDAAKRKGKPKKTAPLGESSILDELTENESSSTESAEGGGGCTKCSKKAGGSKKPCGCSDCSKNKNDSFGGRMAQITINGIGLEVEQELAQILAPVIVRADAADNAMTRLAELEAENADLREVNDGLNETVDELMTMLEDDQEGRTDSDDEIESLRQSTLEVIDMVDELLNEADEEYDEDGNRTDGIDEDELMALIRDGINTVDRVRADAAMLFDAGYLPQAVQLTPDHILQNLYGLQAEMIGTVNKGFKCDAYDETQITAIYDAVMDTARSGLAARQSNNNGSRNRRDSLLDMAGLVRSAGSTASSQDAITAAIFAAQDRAFAAASEMTPGQQTTGYKLA